jgi:phosphoribosyl 1,2-cyclic phosphodiesterase
MRTVSVVPALLCLAAISGMAQQASFYLIDVGHGNAAFVASPSGETMLIDCGTPRVADRIASFMQQNGFKQIDYLVISHFEADHMGAAAGLSKKVPILNWVDHGESVVYGKSDEWWKQRRGPWARPGMGKMDDQRFDEYKAARSTGHHIPVKPGDKVPIKGLDVVVVSAGGKGITAPLKGGGVPNPACAQVDKRTEDDAEDGQSVGVVIAAGRFRYINLGDLTWNAANRLFCPTNLIGKVDAYVVTHHAQSMSNELGAYYHGLSCCSVGEVRGLSPRVAMLTMGREGHKQGGPDAMKVVLGTPGLDLWQTEKVMGGGEAGFNGPDDQIANITGGPAEQVPYIKVTAKPDGAFTVTNSRNGFSKNYPARK